MSSALRFEIILAAISAIGLPTLGVMLRMTVQWTKTQDKLADIASDLKDLEIEAKDDRKAVNERLLFLERFAWKKG